MFQTVDVCAAQCTQLNNCARFVFDVNEKEKPNCWLKTSACTVDDSLGKIVYEKMATGKKIPGFAPIHNATLDFI